MTACICQSGKPYAQCCEPLHCGSKHAKTPEQLMRSRYAAFALGGLGQYLLDTWHCSQRADYSALDLSQRSSDWTGLTIIDKQQRGDEAWVEFCATYQMGWGRDKAHQLHERSRFVREGGRWYYIDGELFDA